jgi:hypothetical protein
MSENLKKPLEEILKERQEKKDVEIQRVNNIINNLNGLSVSQAEFILLKCINNIKYKTIINMS